MKTLRLLAAGLLLAACAKKEAPAPAAAPPGGWLTFESGWVRLSYPPGSEVAEAGDEGVVVTPEPARPDRMDGAVAIGPERKYKDLLLRDALESQVRLFASKGGGSFGGPRAFKVPNANCLGASMLTARGRCPEGSAYRGVGTCWTPTTFIFCDAKDGKRYEISTVLGLTNTKASLSEAGRRQSEVFERIVSTVEFKKP